MYFFIAQMVMNVNDLLWYNPKRNHTTRQGQDRKNLKLTLVGGWTNLFEKNMFVKIGSFSPSFGVKLPKTFKASPS